MNLGALNIGLRTGHIAAVSVLVGGLVFEVEPDRLHLSLGLTIATGLGLVAVEAFTRPRAHVVLRAVCCCVTHNKACKALEPPQGLSAV